MSVLFTLRYCYSHQHFDLTCKIIRVIWMHPSQIWPKHVLSVETLPNEIGFVNCNWRNLDSLYVITTKPCKTLHEWFSIFNRNYSFAQWSHSFKEEMILCFKECNVYNIFILYAYKGVMLSRLPAIKHFYFIYLGIYLQSLFFRKSRHIVIQNCYSSFRLTS